MKHDLHRHLALTGATGVATPGCPACPFVCPDCWTVSHHPEDKKNGYCGRCHKFTDQPQLEPQETP